MRRVEVRKSLPYLILLGALLLSPLAAGVEANPLTCSVEGRVFVTDVGIPFDPLATESPLEGVFVVLESEPRGLYGNVAITDAAGEYQFLDAPPGQYTVAIHVQPELLPGIPDHSTFGAYALDGTVTPLPAGIVSRDPVEVPTTDPFEVFEPGMPRMVDFGSGASLGSGGAELYGMSITQPPGSVTGFVVRPLGVASASVEAVNFLGFAMVGSEQPDVPSEVLSGVQVELTDFIGDPTYPRYVSTLADGSFTLLGAFDSIAGRVAVDDGTGVFVQSTPVAPTGPTHVIFVLPGRLGGFAGRAFVEVGVPNALFDGGDQALPGLTVRLFDPTNLATPLATTTTAPDGTYSFPTSYEDGGYILDIVDPSRPNPLRAGALRAAASDPVDFAFTPETCPDFEDPVVTCPADITVECTRPAGEVVSFTPTATDDCTPPDQIVFSYVPQGPGSTFTLGTTTVTVTATDLAGRTDQCSFDVIVEDTTPPVITLNGAASLTLECGVDTYVELGATASDDCDDSLPAVTIGGDVVNTNALGTYVVRYDVADASGNDAVQVTRTVEVVDTIPPVITSALVRTLLWPARGGMLPPGLSASALDACDGPIQVAVTVFSDEPDGAAPFAPDATGISPATLRLRCERAYPGGNGRFYLLRVTATDLSGNTASTCHSAVVPIMPVGSWILGVRAEAASFEATCLASPFATTLPGLTNLLSFGPVAPPQPQ